MGDVIEYRGSILKVVSDLCSKDYTVWSDEEDLYEVSKARWTSRYFAKVFLLSEDTYSCFGDTPEEALDGCLRLAKIDFDRIEKFFRNLGITGSDL